MPIACLGLSALSQGDRDEKQIQQPERLITALLVIIFDTSSYGSNYHHYGLQGHLLIAMTDRPHEQPYLTHIYYLIKPFLLLEALEETWEV